MPDCPPIAELEAFVAGRDESAEMRAHLASCDACRVRSDEIRADNRLISQLVAAVEPGASKGSRPEPIAPPAAAPPDVDGYRVVRELHRGGQGVIFEAVQLSTERHVALKVLLDGTLASSQHLARFDREIETVLRLRHPNVVTVYDRGTTRDGRRFFTMELVEGTTLDRHGRDRRAAASADPRAAAAELRAALELFMKVCAAVNYAHQRGVIHRDLKPGNVLVDAGGEPRVLDFGLAKAVADEAGAAAATVTRPGWFVGTLAYASPEQLRGDPDHVDVRSDVYSLGVMLHELLTGRFPYAVEGTLPEVARAILETEPKVARELDDELTSILQCALAKEPEHRYQSAGDLGRDLDHWLRGEPIDARRGRLGYLLRKTLKRYRLRVAAAALMLVVIVAAAIVSAVYWKRSAADAKQAHTDARKRARVSGFVEDMLSSVNPDRAKGHSVTVREVLDDAARELDQGLDDEPAVEGELRLLVGRSYRSLGLYDEAQRHFERALALFRSLGDEGRAASALDDLASTAFNQNDFARADTLRAQSIEQLEQLHLQDSVSMAQVLNNLALDFVLKGEYARAEPIYRRAIELMRTLGEEERMARAEGNLGQLLFERDRFAEAERVLRDALAIYRQRGDPELLDVAFAQLHLADVLDATGRSGEARDAAQEAYTIERKLLGDGHLRTVQALSMLAILVERADGYAAAAPLHAEAKRHRAALDGSESLVAAKAINALGMLAKLAGDFDEAERELRAALALLDRIVGREHVAPAAVLGNLSRVLRDCGRFEEAEKCGRESLALRRRLLGGASLAVAQADVDLAWCCGARAAAEDGEKLARESLDLFTKALGPDDVRSCGSREALAWMLHERGADAEAEPIERDNVERQSRTLGEAHPDAARGRGMLGEILESRRQPKDAEQLYRLAIEQLRSQTGKRRVDLADNLHRLGRLLVRAGRMDEALPPLEEALDLRRELYGENHLHLVYSLNTLGVWHMRKGEVDEAAPLFDEALEMSRRILGPNHPDLALSLANVATVATARGDHDAAEVALLESFAILRRARGDRHPDTLSVADLLARHYRAIGRPEEAAKFAAPRAIPSLPPAGSR